MSRILNLVVLSALSTVIVFAGCTPTTTETAQTPDAHDHDHDHDHDHGPALSFEQSLEKTSKLAAKLNQGFIDDAGHDVIHDPLHEISHLLEGLPGQIKESDLSEEDKSALTTAVDTLFDCYGKIDAKFHGGEGVEFADVKDEITEALDSLNKILDSMQ